ncbi:MAG: clostripain-related cysteine peptidase [Clostridia bacterium]|nr:clostripain-related cysteine peptidase [Clostridia bacterium]
MQHQNEKDWVILFYLNGNNELAPEMQQSKCAIDREGSDGKIEVLVQHGSIEKRIVEIMRPQHLFSAYENTTGVKRFRYSGSTPVLAGDLGNINMADPKRLYEFVEWGMENYPARRCMLVLGGHVFQYVGLMPDYSQRLPYLMGYPEMVNALLHIRRKLGKTIDLLVLDTCYVNRIEMLYELGKEDLPPVRSVLTYLSGGPITGLPYELLIKLVKSNSAAELEPLVHQLLNGISHDLIAYEINHHKLERIKNLFNDLAYSRLNNNSEYPVSLSELLVNSDEKLPWNTILRNLQANMQILTIGFKNISNMPFGHFYVSSRQINDPEKVRLYRRLAFAENNYWANLLDTSKSPGETIPATNIDLEPTVITVNGLLALISSMNPCLSAEQNMQILRNLAEYKGWAW